MAIDTLATQLDSLVNIPDSLSIAKDSIEQDLISDPDSLGMEGSTTTDSTFETLDTALIDFDYSPGSELRKVYIMSKWNEDFNYRLTLLPGAVTDIYNRQNDTLTMEFKTSSLK